MRRVVFEGIHRWNFDDYNRLIGLRYNLVRHRYNLVGYRYKSELVRDFDYPGQRHRDEQSPDRD
jgi:hypothetical protein